jgi:nucleoside-diphosphate-sugar epimerase
VSLRALVEALARALGTEAQFDPLPITEAMPYRLGPPDPAEVERARSELGFRPSALEDALPEILAWYRVRKASLPARA